MANIYQIHVEGHLDQAWADYWFEGLTMSLEENGETLLCGPIAGQPALYGLLKKIRDLGLPLVLVERIDTEA